MFPLKIIAPSFRRGIAAIYSILMLMVLCGLVSMGVDLGRVQVAKTELRSAADAAARAGAMGLVDSATQAKDDAVAVAAANVCDGSAVVIDPAADIELGTWNAGSRTFTVLTGSAQNSANAIRVTARKLKTRGTAVPLVFARLIGKSTCDLNAVAIGTMNRDGLRGIIGLNGINFGAFTFVGSYNSVTNPNPNQFSSYNNGELGSNGNIAVGDSLIVWGDVTLGPAGNLSKGSVTGSTIKLAAPIAAPTMPAWAPGINPSGIPQNYTVSTATTLPGGTYWFTTLKIDRDLSFSGPATLYINGNVTIRADLQALDRKPQNLKIYQIGVRKFEAPDVDVNVVAEIEAPQSDLKTKKILFYGSCTFNTIDTGDTAIFFYDESLGPPTGRPVVTLVN
jgi:Flp pilus assembly protein TadG